MEFKADLHMHPSFYSPQSGKKVPRLADIVKYIFNNGLDICAISACHPAAGCIDTRFRDYMKQISFLQKEFDTDYKEKEGILYLKAKSGHFGSFSSDLMILNSQEVRAFYNGMPADINIIGVPEFIEAGNDIDETAKIGRDKGGIVSVCHPASRCGAGIEKAIEMYRSDKINGIEGWDATEDSLTNKIVMNKLSKVGIKGIAVSDSHHYKQAGTAYTTFNIDANFSRQIKTSNKTSRF